MIAALVLFSVLPVRSVSLPAGAVAPLVIRCPLAATTRIVFPEPVVATFSPSAQAKLGLAWERGNASKVALVRPSEHPAQGLLRFTGKRFGQFTLRLETVSAGDSSEVRLAVAPAAEAPAPVPAPPRAAGRPASPGPPMLAAANPGVKTASHTAVKTEPKGARSSLPAPGPGRSGVAGEPERQQRKVASTGLVAGPSELAVEIRKGVVGFENKTGASIPAAMVTLVAADGRRFVPREGTLAPTWETLVAFDRFTPPLTADARIVRAELLQLEARQGHPQAEPVAPASAPPHPTAAAEVLPQPPTTAATPPRQLEESAAPGQALLDPAILTARVRPVGRVEALPGQRPVELADILEAENFLWLRFNVRGGARARVEGVSWEHGPIASYKTEVANKGKDLVVVVQLPKARTTKRTRITLRLDDGPRKFPLSAPWLSSLVKDLLGF